MNRPMPLIVVASLAWIAVLGIGRRLVVEYESTPTAVGESARSWPSGSRLPRREGRPTLLMFAHPHCPCTRASLGELRRIAEECPGAAAVTVLFVRPTGAAEGWERSDLFELAGSIPGVTTRVDPLGVEAKRFGAESSGQVVLFDGGGRLLFSGGITQGRGHPGENDGRDAVVARLKGDESRAARAEAPVFGCPLFDGSGPT